MRNGPQHEGYKAMLRASTNPTYLHGDEYGVVVTSKSKAAPTREDLIEGWMTIPIKTPTQRDGTGRWQYDEKYLTREEAEAKVDALFPQLEAA